MCNRRLSLIPIFYSKDALFRRRFFCVFHGATKAGYTFEMLNLLQPAQSQILNAAKCVRMRLYTLDDANSAFHPPGSARQCVPYMLRVLVKVCYIVFAARRQCVLRRLLWRRGCLSVTFRGCVAVTLMCCAQTTESIIMRPSPDCSPAVLIFSYQT